jgi:D-alanyl-D-alanine carboxypeptidase (penicillin-binding protein 5/6)
MSKRGKCFLMWVLGVMVAATLGLGEAATKPATKAKPVKSSGRASLPTRSAQPYLGAIVVEAATGQVLFEQNADQAGFPASVIKLMDAFVILDRIAEGHLSLSNTVTVTAESSRIGGSQVYLAEHEVFPLEELLYALMVQSANDAASALAIHVGGTAAAFVELMNQKAAALSLTNTRFHSVHGLPPATGQAGDVSSARDLATLSAALIRTHPDILRYTATRERGFRNGEFILRNHNHLLGSYQGCDGLKTGYITAGGFSMVATAERNGRRVIAVVLGSQDRKVRDLHVAELMSKGFAALPPLPPPVPTNAVPSPAVIIPEPAGEIEEAGASSPWLAAAGLGVLGGLLLAGMVAWIIRRGNRAPL